MHIRQNWYKGPGPCILSNNVIQLKVAIVSHIFIMYFEGLGERVRKSRRIKLWLSLQVSDLWVMLTEISLNDLFHMKERQ